MMKKYVWERKLIKLGGNLVISLPREIIKKKKVKEGRIAVLEYNENIDMFYLWI